LPTAARRYLIVTADDFGLHESVNRAVEEASHAGILTAASLMISGPAAADAIARAKQLPLLRVGLHLVLADGWSTLSHTEIPSLTNRDGFMDGNMLRRGIAISVSRSTRRQVEAEMRAQFEAYRRSGLPFDHVNVHKHFHLHPTVLGLLLSLAREYGVPAIRIPHEPFWFCRNHGTWRSCLSAAMLAPLIELMKYRIRAAGIFRNDCVFGIARSGAMDEAMLLSVLSGLPPGVTEIYLHPASQDRGGITGSMAGYRHADELAGLLSVRVRSAVAALNVTRGGYSDVLRSAGRALA